MLTNTVHIKYFTYLIDKTLLNGSKYIYICQMYFAMFTFGFVITCILISLASDTVFVNKIKSKQISLCHWKCSPLSNSEIVLMLCVNTKLSFPFN